MGDKPRFCTDGLKRLIFTQNNFKSFGVMRYFEKSGKKNLSVKHRSEACENKAKVGISFAKIKKIGS